MTTTRWLDSTEQNAWRALLAAHATLVAVLDRELRAEQGMALAEYEALAVLSETPGGYLPMAQLAERLHVSPSALTRRIDRLSARQLVCRRACPTDARVWHAVLTDTGRRRLEAAAPTHVRGVREHFVDRLTRAELEALSVALQAALDPATGSPDPAPPRAR